MRVFLKIAIFIETIILLVAIFISFLYFGSVHQISNGVKLKLILTLIVILIVLIYTILKYRKFE